MIKSKFDFYDLVIVHSNKKKLSSINGKKGIICGKAQDEQDPTIFYYGVGILDESNELDDCWRVPEEDLISTGRQADPKDFQTGERIKVRVDPKTGEGYIVDE